MLMQPHAVLTRDVSDLSDCESSGYIWHTMVEKVRQCYYLIDSVSAQIWFQIE